MENILNTETPNTKVNEVEADATETAQEFDSNKVVELNIKDVMNMFVTMQEGYNVLAELIHGRVEILNDMAEYILPEKLLAMSKKANGLIVNVNDNLDRVDVLAIKIPALEVEYDKYVAIVADESKTELEKDKAMAASIDEFNSLTKELGELNAQLESLTEVYNIFVQTDIDMELRKTAQARDLLLQEKSNLEAEFKGE